MENRKAKICVSICARRAGELFEAVMRAAESGDLVEIRFDYFDRDELSEALNAYARLRRTVTTPLIVTFRPRAEGGHRTISADERIAFWNQCAGLWKNDGKSERNLADLEFQLLSGPEWNDQIPPERRICSYHNLETVPENLAERYEDMAAMPAAILKIAVQAEDATDCIPIFDLIERAQRDKQALIAIAMGQAGVMTRVLGPSRGSFLTYASFDEALATAPGQLSARELRDVYRIDHLDRQTEVMGVIGRPVAHSISPHIHNGAFAEAGLNAVFLPIEVHDLNAFIRRMVRKRSREFDWKLRGLGVTAPHKTAAMKYLDWIEPAAREIGAVNTIVLQDEALRGYNTDAGGFIEPLKRRVPLLSGVRCAVIGVGGAARAVIWALRNEGAAVTVFARNCDKSEAVTSDFGIDCRSLSGATFQTFAVVVNATPLGTRGEAETETPATADQLRGVRFAYDLVYNPLETRFIREAREAGCETIDGLEMFIGQAVEQFTLWTGKKPNVETMRMAAERALNN